MKSLGKVYTLNGATRDVIGPVEILKENDCSDQSPCVSALDDKNVVRRRSPRELQQCRRLTIIVCIVSMFLTFLLSVASFVSCTLSGSSATFAIAFDALLAIISSSTVVWRFCFKCEVSDCYNKERQACSIIALCFIASAIFISTDSLIALIRESRPEKLDYTLGLAIVNTFVYFLLFLVKYSLAEKLESAALRADSIDAITGSATAFSVVISTIIFEENKEAWFVDASVAQVIAVITFVYGLQLLVRVIRLGRNFQNPEEYQKSL